MLDFQLRPRLEFALKWPGMVVLCVNQLEWGKAVEAAIPVQTTQVLGESLHTALLQTVELVRGKVRLRISTFIHIPALTHTHIHTCSHSRTPTLTHIVYIHAYSHPYTYSLLLTHMPTLTHTYVHSSAPLFVVPY
jgi:hypothetical protein